MPFSVTWYTILEQLDVISSDATFVIPLSERSFRVSEAQVHLTPCIVFQYAWDDHGWSGKSHPHEGPKEQSTNPQVASVESA